MWPNKSRGIFDSSTNASNMETVFEQNGFVIMVNGRSTYFLVDPTGHCVFATDTFRKCVNYYNRIFAPRP